MNNLTNNSAINNVECLCINIELFTLKFDILHF